MAEQRDTVLLGDFTVDATTNEQHESAVTISAHKIEDGAEVVDHARKQQDRLTLDCFVSDTPLDTPPEFNDGATIFDDEVEYQVPRRIQASVFGISFSAPYSTALTSGAEPVFGFVTRKAQTKNFTGTINRRQAVYDDLQQKMLEGTPIDVVTRLRWYENMLIESVSTPVTSENGNALQFTVALRQVQFVTAGVANIQVTNLDSNKKKKADGNQSKKGEADDSSRSEQVSLFSRTLGRGGS